MTHVVVSQFTGTHGNERCDVFESGSMLMCEFVFKGMKNYWVGWEESGMSAIPGINRGFWGVYMDKRHSPDSIITLNDDGSVARFRCVESDRRLTYDQDIYLGRD